ncbi:hypothetical protein LPTSP4_35450 [Leptospira ryugenii]|uniref:Gamma-glutamylcyclotransferase AIG2-like domain-containing protein n=2 Tax=Leptospira ryugenii TaxID=1917863 RepID=A0A2P2E561_9LEPT|nr:hypothetical protein LPTSP4_35450 [Leptospira ryugenii]
MYEYERYPILLPKWGSSVWGEIHLLPDSDWEVLDAYEETHLGVYERIFDETYSFYLYIAGANAKIKTSALLPEGLWPSDEFG